MDGDLPCDGPGSFLSGVWSCGGWSIVQVVCPVFTGKGRPSAEFGNLLLDVNKKMRLDNMKKLKNSILSNEQEKWR